MEDVAPGLYEKIHAAYDSANKSDPQLKAFVEKLNRRRATHADVVNAAKRIGKHASDALKEYLTVEALPDGVMYWNIADRTIKPIMTEAHGLINNLATLQKRVQDKTRNLNIGISSGVDPEERIRTVMGFAANSKNAEELASALDVPVKTTALDYVDDFDKKNAEIRNGLGFKQYVIREYDGVGLQHGSVPCEWCLSRAGTWSYQEAIDNGVFERHEGCGCTIEVVTADDLSDDVQPEVDLPF